MQNLQRRGGSTRQLHLTGPPQPGRGQLRIGAGGGGEPAAGGNGAQGDRRGEGPRGGAQVAGDTGGDLGRAAHEAALAGECIVPPAELIAGAVEVSLQDACGTQLRQVAAVRHHHGMDPGLALQGVPHGDAHAFGLAIGGRLRAEILHRQQANALPAGGGRLPAAGGKQQRQPQQTRAHVLPT